ncbi:DinB superfamily protein [Georgenia satyanarayanai]|uniref:DinB superfamily protein n=1 Tax=Georgenia satyanarayanai TaxID=860221 RepID=A0A2Y8ZX11_9MICO|nr:DinB family protein [Georgenia satyanarayanai]PYG02049.1 DinB family protein [Georgenia satyanarayanai]SSA36860.1 DinB superfamily protein [Georgenia satyanarayanai]
MRGDYGAPEFDWSILEVPTPKAMALGQLGFSWLELAGRLATVTQEEFLREPRPGAFNVVRRGEARTPRTLGTGEWVAEWPEGPDEPGPRTIAWLVAHLTETYVERWEWTFGERQRRRQDVVVHGDVDDAREELARWVGAWREGVESVPDDEIMTVGLSQATEIDAAAPFGHLVLHLNRELIHHGSEIFVLTDLYRSDPA